MESRAIKLAKKIATILDGERYEDASKALQMAKIMLPSPVSQRKLQKKQEQSERQAEKQAEQEAEDAGSLPSADEELVRFSKAMGTTHPVKAEEESELQ